MQSVLEAVSRIRSSFKLVNADDILTDRFIAAELKSTASKLIKRETDKRKLFSSDNIFTTIPCLAMEQVPLTECCTYTSECMIARSINKIPKIGENIYGLLIQGLFSVNNKVKFNYVDPNRYVNILKLYPKRTNDSYFWKHNDHIYISNPNIELVKLSAYFEEDVPLELLRCDSNNTCPDNPLDLEFKCPGYLMDDVMNIVRDALMKTYKRSEDDKTVNNNDESH